MTEPPPAFTRFAADLDADLRASLPDPPYLPGLYGMLRYHLGWVDRAFQPSSAPAGKRLRPVLCLLATEAVGGSYRLALPAASAVELVHSFSLVHDDIEDNSPERRHRPTLWKLWGRPQAINAGDVLFAIAFETVARLSELGHPSSLVLQAANLLSLTCRRLCEGQYMDISFEGRQRVSEQEYYEMIAGKTASLIACSAQLGALVGSGTLDSAEPWRRFGFHLGLAFQIQDDILGIWGEESQTGKPRGDDIRQRKKTLPILYALNSAQEPTSSRLQAILHGAGPIPEKQIAEAEALLLQTGAKRYAEEQAEKHLANALLELGAFDSAKPAVIELRQVAEHLLGRSA